MQSLLNLKQNLCIGVDAFFRAYPLANQELLTACKVTKEIANFF